MVFRDYRLKAYQLLLIGLFFLSRHDPANPYAAACALNIASLGEGMKLGQLTGRNDGGLALGPLSSRLVCIIAGLMTANYY